MDKRIQKLDNTVNEIRSISADLVNSINLHGWKMAVLIAVFVGIAWVIIK